MSALDDIAAERKRQIEVEGWTPQHDDDEHYNDELALAASCYARNATYMKSPKDVPALWPWSHEWWKPRTPRRDLVRAGALIIAAIEQIDRAASKEPKP